MSIRYKDDLKNMAGALMAARNPANTDSEVLRGARYLLRENRPMGEQRKNHFLLPTDNGPFQSLAMFHPELFDLYAPYMASVGFMVDLLWRNVDDYRTPQTSILIKCHEPDGTPRVFTVCTLFCEHPVEPHVVFFRRIFNRLKNIYPVRLWSVEVDIPFDQVLYDSLLPFQREYGISLVSSPIHKARKIASVSDIEDVGRIVEFLQFQDEHHSFPAPIREMLIAPIPQSMPNLKTVLIDIAKKISPCVKHDLERMQMLDIAQSREAAFVFQEGILNLCHPNVLASFEEVFARFKRGVTALPLSLLPPPVTLESRHYTWDPPHRLPELLQALTGDRKRD